MSTAEEILKSGVQFGQWWAYIGAIVVTAVAVAAIWWAWNWSRKYTGQTVGQVVQVTCTMKECYLKLNYDVNDKPYETVVKAPMGTYSTGEKFAIDYDPSNPADAIPANEVRYGNWVVFGGFMAIGIAWLWYWIVMQSKFAAVGTGIGGIASLLR